MEAPRPWQFSLSNWSVTRKVGIVLVLPVLLAGVFAVLRINNELRTLELLDAATEQAIIIRPIIAYGAATEQLAVTATATWGSQGDPQADAALARFDQALADLETAVERSAVAPEVTSELSSALAIGTTMRNSLRSGSPTMVGDQADEIAVRIGNALALSPSVEDLTIQRYFLQLTTIHNARRLLTTQRMVISSPEAARNPSMRPRVLTSAGGELVMIYQYGQILPDLAGNMRPLLDAVQTRLATFSQNTADPANNPAVLDSLQISSNTYDVTAAQLMDVIDSSLKDSTITAQNSALRETAIVIAMLLAGLALALAVARTLVVPVRRLRRDALEVAHVMLPNELSVVRGGGATPEITPVAVHSTDEIGQLARAVDEMHEQALNLAAEQARLRVQIGNMFETLSRRSQSLVEQQLSLIEELEHDEDDGERLQSLFRLDHLATRMRRNGDNLLVLAGTALRRGQLLPVPLSDMLWSAVSQVEDYQRVEIGTVPDGVVAGEPAVDIEHLLAELIDNALRYSPPSTPVAVSVSRAVDGGYLIEITDRGLGMSAEDLQATNARLASGGEVTVETARRMGLFVVGRLAKRHTITVGLRRTSTMAQQPGITASVHLPGALVAPPMDDNLDTKTFTGPIEPLPQPRTLVPVPNLPQSGPTPPTGPSGEVKPFGLTSSGLPQRRPITRPADASDQSSGTATPAGGVPVNQGGNGVDSGPLPLRRTDDGDGPEGPRTVQFGPATPLRGRDPLTGPNPVVSREPDEEPTGLWAETHKTEAYALPGFPPKGEEPEPGDSPDIPHTAPPAEPDADREPVQRTTALSGLPIRKPGFDRDEPAAAPAPTDNGSSTGEFRAVESPATSSAADTAAGEPPSARVEPLPTTTEPASSAGDPPSATTSSSRLQPVGGESPTPIYQRMVSEWLVEPASVQPSEAWSSPADAGWLAAEDASKPTTTSRTAGGLPIRRPGAQLVPGGLAPVEDESPRDPEEIRNNLTRHLSGVRSGRADAQHKDDGGLA
ncbi:sensor histidine kinase [Nocardia donostiensis]|uniref:histidine kinase n=1 Tax=Nocardia donostiensis TaxID=1538463 RepID=A0A1V2TG35_9NOCA|nr:ATP-binding protein [Nocardia donostiensis]ONM48341.1 ATP-binding protein [Nocardia donostiensis]OQS14467.1 ATP-binding protein [Nocardia donostiensis]OQS20550.1 ATP-binding protein [Nocardia donostiensis]